MVKTRPTALLLTACLGLLEPARAGAHPEVVPTLVNRYVALTAFETRVDVLVSLLFGQVPAGERRRLMDQDHDGRIDAQELSRERLAWARDPARLIRLSVDGSPVHLLVAPVLDLNGDATVGPRPLLVELRGSFDLAPGERRLRVEVGRALPHVGEAEIALDLAAGWELLGALDARGQRTNPPRALLHFPAGSAGGEAEAVTYSLRTRSGATPVGSHWGGTAWALMAAAVAATVALAVQALRARRRA